MNLVIWILVTLTLTVGSFAENTKFKEVFSWETINYAFPNNRTHSNAISSNKFIPANNLPLDLDVWRNKLFVTVPRFKDGVVSSLNYIDISGFKNGFGNIVTTALGMTPGKRAARASKTPPALIPYPNFETNELQDNCQDTCITSVLRVRVDACDRLWVMDDGRANITGKSKVYSKPQILIYNLRNDRLIKKFVFSDELKVEDSRFNSINVDCTLDKCNNAFAYITDTRGFAMVVYDLKTDNAWRINHNFFYLDPIQGDFNVAGLNFQWPDGITSVALTKPNPNRSRTAFFHALSSTTLFKVNTFTLQDENEGNESNYTAYTIVGDKGPDSQTGSSDIHEPTGVMFYTQFNKNAIYCWNTNKEFTDENLVEVASDSVTMIAADSVKVDYKGNVWALTNKLPLFYADKLDGNEVNYRIFVSTVANAIKDTNCA